MRQAKTAGAPPPAVTEWLRAKRRALAPAPEAVVAFERAMMAGVPEAAAPLFANPFTIGDLDALDETTLRDVLAGGAFGVSVEELAHGLHGAPARLTRRITAALPPSQRVRFQTARPPCGAAATTARQHVLDAFFWELTYWRTPDLYEELTAGEEPHPGIFARLESALRGGVVLDAGAGAGRSTLACLEWGAARVIAVEPSPGLRRILQRKLAGREDGARVEVRAGRFDALPLAAASVDVALACSAFTSRPEQGGEAGLAELRRVTRPGGLIVLIWPSPEDFGWLAAHGFHYAALPITRGLGVRFRSLRSAWRCARRFYARRPAVRRYLRERRCPEVPYRVLGINPPHDYCWLRVEPLPG
ncbi:MAG: class I SAM-dependent methyltransferase [Ktedonobacterales bacterium]|nr:class I SAM-dependent methyltransferase [Ktedonobacterales bacterium]